MMRSLLLLLSSFVIGAHSAASILGTNSAKAVPNSFIVVLKNTATDDAVSSHLAWADRVIKSKGAVRNSTLSFGAFKGYHLQAPEAVASVLAESEEVSA
jgi:hypothetical protein